MKKMQMQKIENPDTLNTIPDDKVIRVGKEVFMFIEEISPPELRGLWANKGYPQIDEKPMLPINGFYCVLDKTK